MENDNFCGGSVKKILAVACVMALFPGFVFAKDRDYNKIKEKEPTNSFFPFRFVDEFVSGVDEEKRMDEIMNSVNVKWADTCNLKPARCVPLEPIEKGE